MNDPRRSARNAFLFGAALLIGPAIGYAATEASAPLTLEVFLDQVKSNNKDLAVYRSTSAAAVGKQAESELMTSTNLFATIQRADDRKPESNPLMGDRAQMLSGTVGVSKLTDFGLSGKISYGVSHTNLSGTNPMFVPQDSYYEAKPTIELSQSLWKNSFGKEVKATKEILQTQTTVNTHIEEFKTDMKFMEAEMSFWRLVLARESVRMTRDSLTRSERLRDWTVGKAKQQLADKADALQTEAAARGRKLELQMAIDEEHAASRALNSLRGRIESEPVEQVVKISPEVLARHPVPTRAPGDSRADTKATIASSKIVAANLILQEQKYKPQLDLFAAATINGKDEALGKANSEALRAAYPTTVIGLRLNAPLGGTSISKQREAALAEAGASALNLDSKKFTEDREWSSLAASMEESRSRVTLANEITHIQKQRSDNERDRQKTGRTTMFQVLMAEQDLAQSELNLIRTQAEMLRIIAQMKTFQSQLKSKSTSQSGAAK